MTEERNWREAKPKWVVEAAEAEMARMKRRLALSWPTEARPTPLPFGWGDYDRMEGTPIEGVYFNSYGNSVKQVEIRKATQTDKTYWKLWRFRYGDIGKFTESVCRGSLF